MIGGDSNGMHTKHMSPDHTKVDLDSKFPDAIWYGPGRTRAKPTRFQHGPSNSQTLTLFSREGRDRLATPLGTWF
ncbi:uncharacterized protein J3R85_017412 [Psidium guajava]|nr:uncharacterized protein J3R85_017412 [Psidium guajava]